MFKTLIYTCVREGNVSKYIRVFFMKKYLYFLLPISLLVVFTVFTILVKTVDVQYISTGNFYLGFYTMNHTVNSWLSYDKLDTMKKLSDAILYISFVFPLAFAITGVYQWITRKSLKKVDPRIYTLLGVYVVVVIVYFVFELAKINYSPIMKPDGSLKASYPSTHVFVTDVLFITGVVTAMSFINIKKAYLEVLVYVLLAVLGIVVGFVRLLSGQHWLSDILASYILTGLIISVYVYFYKKFHPVDEKEEVKAE